MEINGQQCCTGIFHKGEQLEGIWLFHVMDRFQSLLLLEGSESVSGTNFISPKVFSESFSLCKIRCSFLINPPKYRHLLQA